MDFFISNAWAQSAGLGSQDGLMSLLPLVFLFAVMYFILIRPQTKRQKEHRQMVETLKKGDEVVTNGGLLGRIVELGDNFVALEIAKGTEVKVQRQAVSAVMPKGTGKSL